MKHYKIEYDVKCLKYPLQELGFNMKQKYFNAPPIGKITHVCAKLTKILMVH